MEHYFGLRIEEARKTGALTLERVAHMAAERQRDEALNGARRLSHEEALDMLVSVRKWCSPDALAERHEAVAAALRAQGYEV
ncbi:hypothetical protein [Streptomyces collinus]|uniref:hypothetical protein n=1 Tax=Streptomyces collinus TaxID=42684 RepID=UPI0036CC89BB